MKSGRHAMILDIIDKNDIETQEDLAEALRETGYEVTQATISRDIKELRLVKVLTPNNTYKYATVDKADKVMTNRFIRVFSEAVLSIVAANNLVIIKTLSGSAHAAGNTIDSMRWPEIVGSIAGDDTILVVAPDNDAAQVLVAKFKEMMK
ncbi:MULTISPECIES: arginine repressor [unclassified Clostridium]|jgi:transcriptional regulator of arginine metabolism|uniref:arginine repressor n=1 Tax=Clostridia TaxID=186801 RepID=UPI0008232DC3|nr:MULTISPECIES: arginine repressor [unclassified Clostridium]SCJ21854.1 Arginine repressor [uncultured Clostridium sp.]